MSKKSNKTKKTKIVKQSPFDVGLDAEQVLADSLCKQFLKVGVEKDAIDEAFIGAFQGFSHRMLNIYNKEFVLELIAQMSEIVDEEHGEHGEHVCEDCQEKLDSGETLTKTVSDKMH